MSVQTVPFLQTEAVTGTQTDGGETKGLTYLKQRIPDLQTFVSREIKLEATGTGVACIREDHTRYTGKTPLTERIVIDGLEVRIGEELQQLRRLRSLYGQLSVPLRSVLEFQIGIREFLITDFVYPRPVFVDIAGVYDHEVFGGRVLVDDQVVHDTAFAVGHTGVLTFACRNDAEVVGGDILQKIQGFLTFYPELTHVAHVEHTHALTDDHVLLIDTRRVLDRHVKACKFCHLGTECNMHIGKRSCF